MSPSTIERALHVMVLCFGLIVSACGSTSENKKKEMDSTDSDAVATCQPTVPTRLLWTFDLEDTLHALAVGLDGTIYVPSVHLFALDQTDGTERWIFEAPGNRYAAAAVGLDNTVYFIHNDFVEAGMVSMTSAIDPTNGSEIWSREIVGEVWPPAVGPDGTVYVPGEDLYALNPSDGSVIWSSNIESGAITPLITQGGIFVSSRWVHELQALDPSNGSMHWSFGLGSIWEDLFNTPIADMDGRILLPSSSLMDDHRLYALDPEDGSTLWSFSSTVGVGKPALGLDSVVYVPSGTLYALRTSDGSEVWSSTVKYTGTPAVASDGTIYEASRGSLVALNPSNAEELWSVVTDSAYNSADPVLTADETIVVTATEARVYAISTATDIAPTECTPCTLGCLDEQTVGLCLPDGSEYTDHEACEAGLICRYGLCLEPSETDTDTATSADCLKDVDCDDGLDCTVDACGQNGECMSTPDNSKCGRFEICIPEQGCIDTGRECLLDNDCDDGVDCTIDICGQNGECTIAPDDAFCEAIDLCWTDAVCNPDSGCEGEERVCDQPEEPSCYDITCNPETGACDTALLKPGADDDDDGYCDDNEAFGGDDCNDKDADTNPGQEEVCNDFDDNCDGVTDEGC